MSTRLPKEIRHLVHILANEDAMPHEISPQVVAEARAAGVLEALAARPGMRAVLGKSAADYFIAQVAMGAMRLHEFRQIALAMDRKGIPLVPLKGMAYALMFEKGGPTRAMDDIDLLVPPDQFEAAGAVMRELGYQEKALGPIEQSPGYHERGFCRDGRLVEIHPFFLRRGRVTIDYDVLWARTIRVERGDVVWRRLSPEDTFLYHCLHMGQHEFATQGLRAVWELRRLMLQDRPDLAVTARRAREWSVVRMTWCALRLLEECFPGALPSIATPKQSQQGSNPRSGRAPSNAPDCDPRALRLFQPPWPVRVLLEKFVVEASIGLLLKPKLLPRPVQIFRKGLLVDRLSGAISYLGWYSKAVFSARQNPTQMS